MHAYFQIETIDHGKELDPRSRKPRNPIKLCTRTPFSSPDRRRELMDHWKEEMKMEEEVPCPSITHPAVTQGESAL